MSWRKLQNAGENKYNHTIQKEKSGSKSSQEVIQDAQSHASTLNQYDRNTFVRQISDDTAAKRLTGLPEAQLLFKIAWWYFQMLGPVDFFVEMD